MMRVNEEAKCLKEQHIFFISFHFWQHAVLLWQMVEHDGIESAKHSFTIRIRTVQ